MEGLCLSQSLSEWCEPDFLDPEWCDPEPDLLDPEWWEPDF